MIRVAQDAYDDALAQPHAKPMNFTGRTMRGFLFIDPAGGAEGAVLEPWVRQGVS